MRLAIDPNKCEGHARCIARAPELFDVDDDGFGIVLVEELEEQQHADARSAVNACPERAITLSED